MDQEPSAGTTLLVVDGDTIWREGLAAVLGREGYSLLLAANAEEAWARLADGESPDLILLDLVMPTSDGWNFLEKRRRRQVARHVPLVLMTVSAGADREWALDHGAAGLVFKPTTVEALLAEVRRCLQREPLLPPSLDKPGRPPGRRSP